MSTCSDGRGGGVWVEGYEGFMWRGQMRARDGGGAGLVTAAGTAGGLGRLRQVHPPVPAAAGAGGLRLVLG